jgi:transposase
VITKCHAEQLADDPQLLRAALMTVLAERDEALRRLRLHLALRFGPRIEKLDANQLALFAKECREVEKSVQSESVVIPAHERRKGPRAPIPADLPREDRLHDLSPEARLCPCCEEPRVVIATDVHEVVEVIPATIKVIRHLRPVYACPSCSGQIAKAPAPSLPLGKSYAGASLLSLVAVSKFADHAPLYRQEGMLARSGLDLSRSTMCGWLAEGALLIAPLVDLLRREVLQSKVIQTDDTPVPTLGLVKGRAKEGRMWVYLGDELHRHAVFEYSTSREGKWPQQWLKDFEGALQSDAFAGYGSVHDSGVVEVACWAHARRKFHESRDLAPGFCLDVMTRIAQLYAVERKARPRPEDQPAPVLSDEERAVLRLEQSKPALKDLLAFLESNRDEHLPKSPVRGAIEYILQRTEAFTRYLDDGALEIDNNACERALRCVAIGRKNWLFAGSAFGGERAANWLTLIASARLAEVEPWVWLTDILNRLAVLRDACSPPEQRDAALRALLPAAWLARHPEAKLALGR